MGTAIDLTDVENKIANISNLAQNTDYNTKVSEIKNKIITDHDPDKYITTEKFKKLASENFTARLKQANLTSKSDIAYSVKKTDFDNKLKDALSSKNELHKLSKKFKTISTKELIKDSTNKVSILNGAKFFSSWIF